MATETTVTTPRAEHEHTTYIAEGRVVRAQPEQGALRCGWQSTNGTLTCRWDWVALRGAETTDSVDVAA